MNEERSNYLIPKSSYRYVHFIFHDDGLFNFLSILNHYFDQTRRNVKVQKLFHPTEIFFILDLLYFYL